MCEISFVFLAKKVVSNEVMSLDSKLSFWALGISVAAIGVSLFTVWWQMRNEDKRQTIDLKSSYYKEIYWEYLIKKIPEARSLVSHNQRKNKILGTDTIVDELNNIRRDSIFFRFTDEDFYNDICEKLQNLEDKYVKADKMISKKYDEFNQEVDEMLVEIYDLITSKYTGQKIK